MKRFKLDSENPDIELIYKAIDILKNDGVILYPTDTIYGLGANIFSDSAVRRIYKIKERSSKKPLSILVSNFDGLKLVAETKGKEEIIKKYLPGPYTFILRRKRIVPSVVTSYTSKVGVRIPNNKISRLLSMNFPITTTSANISNKEVMSNPDDIMKQLKKEVDLIIDVGELKCKNPSTIIDLTKDEPKIIRDGRNYKNSN
ncbi:threonylcarbamoyl-AMP synthase [Methanobrevibacter sp. 87.7]|uniref:L-threonylcarbamoyladenylate synthase n=1 Tax=Methanobrevibacter sp. 87.7 TaxID=387957 RepID=UPI000B5026EC|nr:L-threonylcarbamoyladenylate synthase [Methanobrevibacter sp. 87.7]OWT33828.1 threonylcarbamoyl-AMP synthase [Methanobrevibacter sp. 87.7]